MKRFWSFGGVTASSIGPRILSAPRYDHRYEARGELEPAGERADVNLVTGTKDRVHGPRRLLRPVTGESLFGPATRRDRVSFDRDRDVSPRPRGFDRGHIRSQPDRPPGPSPVDPEQGRPYAAGSSADPGLDHHRPTDKRRWTRHRIPFPDLRSAADPAGGVASFAPGGFQTHAPTLEGTAHVGRRADSSRHHLVVAHIQAGVEAAELGRPIFERLDVPEDATPAEFEETIAEIFDDLAIPEEQRATIQHSGHWSAMAPLLWGSWYWLSSSPSECAVSGSPPGRSG